MTVQAPIRIHVMGVSGVAGVQMTGRNKWLERWWGKHNSQMGLAGDDEASGTNLPCMHKCASVSFALSLCYSAVLLCDRLLCSLFIFHLVFSLSLCVWMRTDLLTILCCRLLSSPQFFGVSLPTSCEKAERERRKWAWPCSWVLF